MNVIYIKHSIDIEKKSGTVSKKVEVSLDIGDCKE
jgi:hypothetical protein